MQSDKFGEIWVYSKSPFSNDYSNTIKFNTQQEMDSFFQTSLLLTQIHYQDSCSYMRSTGTMIVSNLMDENDKNSANPAKFESATYMRYRNETGRMYYAFVIDHFVDNNGATNLFFEIDVWNTYQLEFWKKEFGGFAEQLTQKNFRDHTDASGNRVRNVLEVNQGFNVGNRKAVTGSTIELDIDWLVFVMLPSAKLNSADNGNAGFPGTYKAFRYFVVPADVESGRTYDYTFNGQRVNGTSIQSYMDAFTNLFADDGTTNTVNQCVSCYTSKYIGINYSLVDGVVFIDKQNVTGQIVGPNTNATPGGSTGGSGQGIAGGWLDGSVDYTGGSLSYGGQTLDSNMITGVILSCREYKLWPEAVIAQMYYESNWGNSNVARSDNNWSGIKYNESWERTCLEQCNVVITQGTAATDGGYFARYDNSREWLATHYYLLRDGGLYVANGKTSVRGYGEGLFKEGGAQADYATGGMAPYVNTLVAVANSIRTANGDAVIDQINKLVYDANNVAEISGANVESILSVAAQEIGYVQKASNSNLDDPTANDGTHLSSAYGYTKYSRDMATIKGNSGNPNPWCANFASWCAYQIGMGDWAFPYTAGCREMYNWGVRNGTVTTSPQPGDLALRGPGDHVGIIESVSGSSITTIDGNWTRRVARHTESGYWTHYVRPNYANSLTLSGWNSNNAVEQVAGLKFLQDNLGVVFGDGTSTAGVAMYSGAMDGPNLGAGTIYSPPDLADGVQNVPNPQDAYFQYAWSKFNFGVQAGPISLSSLRIGSIISIVGTGNMEIPYDTEEERDYNWSRGYICVVKAKSTTEGTITAFCHNSIRGVFEHTFIYDADSVLGANTLPSDIYYNDTEWNSSSSASVSSGGDIVDGSYTETINGVAALEVIRIRRAVTRRIDLPDIFKLIDIAYSELLGTNYESQLMSSEFSYATLYDLFGNSYDFHPEKLPDAEGGEWQIDGLNNDTVAYMSGNHVLRITGSLGESNHVHYVVEDYNIVPKLSTLQTDQTNIEAVQNNEYSYGIKDSNPRSITVISDRTALFIQSNSNQYGANLTAFAENYDMLKLQEQQNNAQLALTNEQATYNSNYAIESAKWNIAQTAANGLLSIAGGIGGGLITGGIPGAIIGGGGALASSALNIGSSVRALGNQQQNAQFTQEQNSLRTQSVALGNMQAKLALNQSVRSYNASVKDAHNQPDSVQQIGQDMSFQSSNRKDNIYLKVMIPNELQLINANNYIKAFGVVYNGLVTDIRDIVNQRERFNYIKCATIEIPEIEINQSHLAALKSVFITGVRIWNNTADIDQTFGDLGVNNMDK